MRGWFPRVMVVVGLVGLGCGLILPPANSELLNGSFDQQLNVGWKADPWSSAEAVYEQGDSFGQLRSNHAAKVTRFDQGYAQLSQVVELTDLDYRLSFDARFLLGGSLSCNPSARVAVGFLTDANQELGRTEWCLPSPDTAWSSGDTCFFRRVPEAGVWHSYSLSLRAELADHLKGVNPADVKRLRIVIEPLVESSG
jgi:hypothetical protein